MIASRVTVDENLVKLANAPLSRKRKRELRQESVLAYIKSKPLGTRIKMAEFKNIMHMNYDNEAALFLKSMEKKGLLQRENLSPRKFTYVVPEEVTVVKEAKKPEPPKNQVSDVEERAMRYLWENPEGDVRGFIAYLKGEKNEVQRPTPQS